MSNEYLGSENQKYGHVGGIMNKTAPLSDYE